MNGLNGGSILGIGEHILIPGGTTTSAAAEQSTPAPSSPSAATVSATALGIIQLTEHMLGVRYIWGGASPSGFDCSGLVEYVYAQVAHLSLPHASLIQFEMGQSVSMANLQPADLVFFNTDGPGATHDGIYIGSGQFISAQTPATGVQWGSLYSAYWKEHYIGARRIL